jgi:hypothetical protein
LYKGEILDLTKRRGLLPEPEPRRDSRDRRDRGGRDRDRRDRGAFQGERSAPPVATAPPASQPSGPAMQVPPSDLPHPAARPVTPILPPLMSPQQPSWKQEARQETAPAGEPGASEAHVAETKPAEEKPRENQ